MLEPQRVDDDQIKAALVRLEETDVDAANTLRAVLDGQQTDDELLSLRYVPLTQVVLWEDNPKLHDIGGIVGAIKKHGFKDPMKYEPAINGLGHGNGRATALMVMFEQGEDPPRGIPVGPDGVWAVPVLFGVDAVSKNAAMAYAIDHNNLTVVGGDFTIWEISRLWDDGFNSVLYQLATENELPTTIDGDDADALLGGLFKSADDQEAELPAELDWSDEWDGGDDDGVGFVFGELKATVESSVYTEFAGRVMRAGSIQKVLTECLETTDTAEGSTG
jgi:hypothetical protein